MLDSRGKKLRKTFGVLIDWVSGQFQHQIQSGIKAFASQADVNVLTFVIGRPDSPFAWESKRAEILNLIPRLAPDGLILYTGGIKAFTKSDGFMSLLNRLGQFPMVSVAEILPRIPSLVCDNKIGFRQLLDHLYALGYRNFALAGGQRGMHDTEERRRTFSTFLQNNQLADEEERYFDGEFTHRSGILAVQELVTQRKLALDALVCGDDLIALGAIEELQRLGLQVPADLAVTGFDDTEDAKNASLTTVAQPLYKLGYQSAQTLLDLLENRPVSQVQVLPTQLVRRQSCGGLRYFIQTMASQSGSSGLPLPDYLAQRKSEILQILTGMGLDEQRAKPFQEAIIKVLTDLDTEAFFSSLQRLLKTSGRQQFIFSTLHALVAQLRHWVLQAALTDKERLFVEPLIHQSQLFVAEIVQTYNIRFNMHQNYLKQVFTHVTSLTFYAQSLDEQIRHLAEFLPQLEIPCFHYFLFENLQDHSQGIRLRLSLRNGHPQELPPEGKLLTLDQNFLKNLMVDDLPWSLTMESLFNRDDPLGFLLMDTEESTQAHLIMDKLGDEISHGLELIQLIGDLENKVRLRTEALETALVELENYSGQLKELALYDDLTGLNNRRGFLTLAAHQLKMVARSDKPQVLFMGDLDGMTNINDNFGKDQGDEAIRTSARLLLASLRNQDLVARIGGDEFAALVSDCNDDIARHLKERIYRTLEAYNRHSAKPWAIGLTLGWRTIQGDSIDLDEALRLAADELFKEKETRKNRGLKN